ncbi:MAG: nucleoside recognition domain-containing protein, partial [Bacillota bacterium]
VVRETQDGATFATVLGRAMLRPITGLPMLAVILGIMYYLIGVVVAQDIVGFTEGTVMVGYYEPWMRGLISRVIPLEGFVGQLLGGEFGVLTMTVTYLLGLLLPLVIAFYLILSAMEDSGYLPRLAALVDRSLTLIGLNGRAIIPIILGFGCVTMATITTRLLGSQRERTIAAFLLGFTIPCSAQLGVITGMLAALGPQLTLLYVATIFIIFALTGTVLNKMLPGESTHLLIDLPPLRLPRLGNVLKKTGMKTYMFMQDAGPLFVLGAVIISVLQLTGALTAIQNALAPMTTGWLKLPKEAANAFIMGLVRRDFGAAGLSNMPLSPVQTMVSLVVITLFVPCIASIMVLFKERNWREAAAIWFGSWILAFSVGGILAQILM